MREANLDPRYLDKMLFLRRSNARPPFTVGGFCSNLTVAYIWAQLFTVAIPDVEIWDVNLACLHWLLPLVVALGEFNSIR